MRIHREIKIVNAKGAEGIVRLDLSTDLNGHSMLADRTGFLETAMSCLAVELRDALSGISACPEPPRRGGCFCPMSCPGRCANCARGKDA